jgi:hypothetical protein
VMSVREERNNWRTASIGESEARCLMDSKEDRSEWAVSKGPKGIGVSKSLIKAEPSGNGTEWDPNQDNRSDQTRCRKLGHPTRDLLEYSSPLEV